MRASLLDGIRWALALMLGTALYGVESRPRRRRKASQTGPTSPPSCAC